MGSPGHSVMHQAILVSSSRQGSNYCVCLLHGNHSVQNPPHNRKHRPTLPNSDSSSLVSRTFSRLSPRSWVSGPAHHGHCVCVMRSPQKFLRALIPGHLFHGTPGLSRYGAVLCYIQTSSTLSGSHQLWQASLSSDLLQEVPLHLECVLSHVQLFVTPWTVARQAPLSIGFSRQEYWSGLPFSSPRALPGPGIKLESPALVGGFFTTELPGKPMRLAPNPRVLTS